MLAPGNLYASILPNMLVGGIPEALRNARAPMICVLNLMTVFGETQGYTASRHIVEIERYAGRVPNGMM